MNGRTIVVVLLVLLIVGMFPATHAFNWNPGYSGGLGTVLLIVLLLLLFGVI